MAGGDGGGEPGSPPACNQNFRIALSGVRAASLAAFTVGGDLEVSLEREGVYLTAVCRDPATGQFLGSLAAYRGLAELIQCLELGFTYTAQVVSLTAASVEVHVRRAPT